MIARSVWALSWLIVGSVSVEGIARQLLRTRVVPLLPEAPLGLAVVALGALVLGTIANRRVRPLVFGAAFACGLALQLQSGARLQSDAFYYYAYLRSATFDGDVSLANDYRMLGLGDKPHLFEPTRTGYAHSAWTVGPAFVWAPFFGVGHMAATSLAAAGHEVATDGTSYPYRQSIVIAGLVYALIGWWLTLRLCETWFTARVAAAATALVAIGTFMFWYAIIEPTMTHAPSMAAVAGFLLLWSKTRHRQTLRIWIALGAIAGFMALIRWQNLLFALVPACDALATRWRAWRSGRRAHATAVIVGGLAFMGAATVAFLPQMVAWHAIYGSWLAVSPVGPQIRLASPEFELTLFSSRNGLLAMTPLLYVAFVGLLAFVVRHRAVGIPLVVASAAMVWFNASIQDWWGSDGFGGRRFDGLMPIAALGVATALGGLRQFVATRPQWVIGSAVAILVIWNLTFMAAAQRGIVRLGEAAAFDRVTGEQAKIWHAWVGHPFSAPASLWFALRNGVSPATYDRLGPALFLGDPLQQTGRVDIGGDDELFIGHGWHAAEQTANSTFRWSNDRAALTIPLARVVPLAVQIRLRAFSYPGAPLQRLWLQTGGERFGPFDVGPDWHDVTFDTPAEAWRAGLNRVTLEFAMAATPASVGLGGDNRPLAAAVDVFRVTAK